MTVKTVKIVDINGKERVVKRLKAVKHRIRDQINERDIIEEYVEATIVGRHGREWIEYYPMDEFRKKNPEVKI